MSPIKKEADPNLVAQMCTKVNADFDGAQIALDLITPKLHSDQEWQALIALYVRVFSPLASSKCFLFCLFYYDILKRFLKHVLKTAVIDFTILLAVFDFLTK